MLTEEWRHRINTWRNELLNQFYSKLGEIDFRGFFTRDLIRFDEAINRDFHPVKPGARWGEKWEYGWFRGEVTLPEDAKGERIVIQVDVGGECAIYVGGVLAGCRDRKLREVTLARPREVTLTAEGYPGKSFDVVVEAYAGHGPTPWTVGPAPPGRATVPEPKGKQAVVGENSFGIWHEDVYQLWLDVETLYELRDNIDQDSLRVAEIDQGLRDFTSIVDFELPHEEMMQTVKTCRGHLRRLLECVNGSTAPTLYAFGHAHIDIAWLWPLDETIRKCARTFSSQLALMGEYGEYKFLQSQPQLYQMVKTHYPELYESMKRAVRSGQLLPEGGMWVEADTNIPSGESLIRQFLHGKRFFREEFCVDCEVLWLPDVFGYSGSLPQIMRGCGVRYFSTHKIFWLYNGGDPFPYNTFTWEGIDGSEVLVHIHGDYSSHTNPASVITSWRERVQKDGFSTRLLPFGFGDGGGGPARDHLEFIRRLRDLEGVPRVKIASPAEYFRDQEAKGAPARYVGELYYQNHRGTYTSQARTKRGNRKSEFALREAEMWGSAAMILKGYSYPMKAMDEAWKAVLLNQFHDVIPGSSIHRVYEEAEAAYAFSIRTAGNVIEESVSCIAEASEALTVFNSMSWDRVSLVTIPEGWRGAETMDGRLLPIQTIEGKHLVEVQIPSCGWTTIKPAEATETDNALRASNNLLENNLLRALFNKKGEIVSIWDKETDIELTAGPCNSFKMYKDVPTAFDAWDINSMYSLTPIELEEEAKIEVVAKGPLVAMIRISRKIHDSKMTQEILLRRGSRRIDFRTIIDWQERHKLLKVNFPVNVHSNEAVHEIQFGHISRPNHMSRPFDADRFEVPAQKWTALMESDRGCAVLNDCKYGVNVSGNNINLTLLRAPLAPDMTADLGSQEFSYAFLSWNGAFTECELIREAYDLNYPVTTMKGAAGEVSLFSLSSQNVILETIKPAEDGSGDIVLRMYESKRTATRCKMHTPLELVEVIEADMLENSKRMLNTSKHDITLEFSPFEIKTIRLKARAQASPL